jgi:AraC-like DNA-binding protein
LVRPKGIPNPNAGRNRIRVRPLSVGIPEKEIILDQVLYWVDLQATAQEIAGSFHVSVSTLDRRIQEYFGVNFEELKKRCSGAAKMSVRRYQFQLAKTNTTMCIWLGKQWLGQKDDPSEDFAKTNQLVQTLLNEIMEMKKQRIEDLNRAAQPIYDGHPDAQK